MDDVEDFPEARKLRMALKPRMTLREMARKMDVSCMYLSDLERGGRGRVGWPVARKKTFIRLLKEWTNHPTPKARKKRTLKAEMLKRRGLLPVPHPHGSLVGIG